MGGTGKTPRDGVITTRQERNSGTYPWCKVLNVGGVSTELDASNFWHLPDTLNDEVGETTGVVLEVIVVDVADTNGTFNGKGVFLVSGLEEIEIVVQVEECRLSFNMTMYKLLRT